MSDILENSSLLGYYFIIFQSNLNNFVKCWFDGNEYYDYMNIDDFLNLFFKINSTNDLIVQAQNCLNTTGIYLWDINNKKIKQLYNNNDFEGSIGQDLNNVFKDFKKSLDNEERILYRF